MRGVLACLFGVAVAGLGIAQTTPMHNEDVIRLVRAGLSEELVLAKIRMSETSFDMSTDAMVALAEARVPEPVIKAMMASTASPTEVPAAAPVGSEPPAPAPTAAPAPGELLLADLARTRGLCSAFGDLRATTKALVYVPVKVTKVCEDYLSSTAFEIPWGELKSVCFEYAISGTLVLTLEDGRDYSLKDRIPVIEGLEKRLKELHPELPYHCD